MSKKSNLYLGKAGEFAIISEFLCRGWNVAIPEVDSGDDVFVIRDENGEFLRVQVKTANGIGTKSGFKAQFNLSARQVIGPFTPELIFAFAVRRNDAWEPFVIVARETLYKLLGNRFETPNPPSSLNLILKKENDALFLGGQDIASFVQNFEKFPTIFH